MDSNSHHKSRTSTVSRTQQQQQQHGTSSSSSSSKVSHRKVVPYLLNFGIILSLFVTIIQIFDPTLDNHINTIQIQQHQIMIIQQPPFTVNLQQHQQQKESSNSKITNNNNNKNEQSSDQNRVLQLLNMAGVTNLNSTQMELLPKWYDIERLYGDDVIIYGKDRCSTFQSTVPKEKMILGVAGMFNTGTNLLAIQMEHNILGMKSLWQVPWGKHRMEYVKDNHTAPRMDHYNKNDVLPVVVIRDPYSWMQSMCKSPYAAHWQHTYRHCPNLVQTESSSSSSSSSSSNYDVVVKFDEHHSVHFDSLVHLWSEWYSLYVKATYPLLLIRYEDLIFQPTKVLAEIANCVGAGVTSKLVVQLKSSKAHGSGTDFIKAITKTADVSARIKNMTQPDFNYATKHLDPNLMRMFRYKHPSEL